MKNRDFFLALEDLQREKGIDQDVFMSALEQALTSACKKSFGEALNVSVRLNAEQSSIRIFSYKTVVEEVNDPDKEISLEDAQIIKKTYELGDQVMNEIFPKDFGRIAAQTAKNTIMNLLQQAEKNITYNQFIQKENELLIGIVSRLKEDGTIFVEIGKNQMEGILLPSDQIPNEKFAPGDRIKVYVKKVKEGTKGTQVTLSRASFGLIKRMFENEVPEIRDGIVVIKGIVREAGFRTKIAVYSSDPEIDAVGACVGNKGTRVNAIVNEIGGEKIDIIPWSEDILDFLARSISPAKVLMVQADENTKEARVIVPDDKLSLAIGKEGQNARLAARLTGWKIDVKSYSAALASGLFDENTAQELSDNPTPTQSLESGDFSLDDISRLVEDRREAQKKIIQKQTEEINQDEQQEQPTTRDND
ncbi:MAG: transcription termination factor NusA [Clostridia bacterium]|nr:transcription termination factor NusA [Clostridia bacterium]